MTTVRRCRSLVLGTFLVLLPLPGLGPGLAQAQVLRRLRRAAEDAIDAVPSLTDLGEREPLKSEPADAVRSIPFLDGFRPAVSTPILVAQQTEDFRFLLEPGVYSYQAEGFCLKSGTYRPGPGGKGYLYAPIYGPMADIVTAILQGSWRHPEVAQRDIQVLLWAIVASTRFQDMPAPAQATARTLLSEEQVRRMQTEGISADLEKRLSRVIAGAPDPLRSILKSEARLRSVLSKGEVRYEKIEAAAIRAGTAPPGEDTVPAGRWSYHPEGYFVSYKPRFYQEVRVTISLPPDIRVAWDELGRVVSVEDPRGNRISAWYQGGREDGHGFHRFDSLSFSAVPRGRVASSVRRRLWVHVNEEPTPVRRSWAGVGGTYTTLADAESATRDTGWRPSPQVRSLRDWFDAFGEGAGVVLDEAGRRRLESLALLAQGVEGVVSGGTTTDERRFGQAAVDLVYLAWQGELQGLMEGVKAGPGTSSLWVLESGGETRSGPSAPSLAWMDAPVVGGAARGRPKSAGGVEASGIQAVIMPQIGRYAQRLAAGRIRPDALWDVDIAVDMVAEDNPGLSRADLEDVREGFLLMYPRLFQQTAAPALSVPDPPPRPCGLWSPASDCGVEIAVGWHSRINAAETVPADPYRPGETVYR